MSIISTLLLAGCGKAAGPKYKVDYDGDKDMYQQAKDEYAAGEKVELIYYMIATDTDYTFYLDGEYFKPDYENEAFVLRFEMPDHDIKITCESRNTMDPE